MKKTIKNSSDNESEAGSDVEELDDEEEETTTTSKKKTTRRSKEDADDDKDCVAIESSTSIRKVFLANKEIGLIGWENIEAVHLPHPRNGRKSIFLVDTRNCIESPEIQKFFIFEVLTQNQPTRSWFVDESIVRDGDMKVSTQIDPLFIILPCLIKSKQAKPLQDHLFEFFPSTKIVDIFCNRIPAAQLENIAIKKEIGDIEAYCYSEEKTLLWLEKKVKKVADFLSLKKLNHSEAAISSNFVKVDDVSEKEENKKAEVAEEYLRYACDIVSEYLEDSLKVQIFAKFGLAIQLPSKRKGKDDLNGSQNGKKVKLENGESARVEPLEDYGTKSNSASNTKNAKGTAKDAQLQKAAKGTVSLFKFFAAKPAK